VNAVQVSTPATGVVALSDAALIPGLGFLPISAYLLSAEQPVLVDTGMPDSRSDLLDALWNRIDPADLRWIYLTHPDRDHTGSLMEILEAAPAARLVTTFLGLGILTMGTRSHPIECSCSIPDSRSMSATAG
jgi:glyoxylase-like metal-dependent hydrolase (beta-lactamase superfamily II)